MQITFQGTRATILAEVLEAFPELNACVSGDYTKALAEWQVEFQKYLKATSADATTTEAATATATEATAGGEETTGKTRTRRTKAEIEAARTAEQATVDARHAETTALRAEVKTMRDTVGGDTAKRLMDLAHCTDLETAPLETLQKLAGEFKAVLAHREAEAKKPVSSPAGSATGSAQTDKPAATAGHADTAPSKADVVAALVKLKEDKGEAVAHGVLPSLKLGKLATVDPKEYPRILEAIQAEYAASAEDTDF